jgi:hypothetical protein
MTDYLAAIRQGLVAMGVPVDFVASLTRNLAGNDIVAVATRLALVGVLAAVLRSSLTKWQNRLFESKSCPTPKRDKPLMISPLPYRLYPIY